MTTARAVGSSLATVVEPTAEHAGADGKVVIYENHSNLKPRGLQPDMKTWAKRFHAMLFQCP